MTSQWSWPFFICIYASTTAPVTALKALGLIVSRWWKQQARAVQKHERPSGLTPAEWSQSSVLEQDRHPYMVLLLAPLKITASPGRQHRQHTSPSTSQPHLHLNCHWFIDFLLRGWWGAPFIWNGFHFIAMMALSHQSEKPKPFRQAYYLPTPCASSNKSVTGNSSRRTFFFSLQNVSFWIPVSIHQSSALYIKKGLMFF